MIPLQLLDPLGLLVKRRKLQSRVFFCFYFVDMKILFKNPNPQNKSRNERCVRHNKYSLPMSGSQGCSQEWMGMVSVSGFQFSTSCCSLGRASCSKQFRITQGGKTSIQVSRTSMIGSQSLTVHLLKYTTTQGLYTQVSSTSMIGSQSLTVHLLKYTTTQGLYTQVSSTSMIGSQSLTVHLLKYTTTQGLYTQVSSTSMIGSQSRTVHLLKYTTTQGLYSIYPGLQHLYDRVTISHHPLTEIHNNTRIIHPSFKELHVIAVAKIL